MLVVKNDVSDVCLVCAVTVMEPETHMQSVVLHEVTYRAFYTKQAPKVLKCPNVLLKG